MLSFILVLTQQNEEDLLVLDQCRGRVLKDILMSNYGMAKEITGESMQYKDVESLVSSSGFNMLYY